MPVAHDAGTISNRISPFLHALHPRPPDDSVITATALEQGFIVPTRNAADVTGIGVEIHVLWVWALRVDRRSTEARSPWSRQTRFTRFTRGPGFTLSIVRRDFAMSDLVPLRRPESWYGLFTLDATTEVAAEFRARPIATRARTCAPLRRGLGMTTYLLDTNSASHVIEGDIPRVRGRLVARRPCTALPCPW